MTVLEQVIGYCFFMMAFSKKMLSLCVETGKLGYPQGMVPAFFCLLGFNFCLGYM